MSSPAGPAGVNNTSFIIVATAQYACLVACHSGCRNDIMPEATSAGCRRALEFAMPSHWKTGFQIRFFDVVLVGGASLERRRAQHPITGLKSPGNASFTPIRSHVNE